MSGDATSGDGTPPAPAARPRPGAGRGLPPAGAPVRTRSRITSGMTIVMAGALALAGCAGIATARQAAPPPQPAQAAPPPQPAQAGPPSMPQPLTLTQRPGASGGEALYVEHCASCHGPNGMGTGLLGRTRPVALLEARGDLAAQYVILAARNGIGNMPAIPRGEVSDEQLQAIADYLAAGPHGGAAR